MRRYLTDPLVLVAGCLAAFWPVWRWYLARMTDGSDEPWGALALLTFVAFVARQRPTPRREARALILPTAVAALYVVAYWHVPPILRAALAVVVLGSLISTCFLASRLHLGALGLLVLSLPVMASLQFYLGYPLRALAAKSSALLLGLSGFHVAAEGAALNWGGQLVSVDAPCSGIRMLWVGLYLACALACLCDLRSRQTCLALAGAAAAVLLGNVLRACSLFYLEAGLLHGPGWWHGAIGIAAFALTAAAIAACVRTLGRRTPCAQPASA